MRHLIASESEPCSILQVYNQQADLEQIRDSVNTGLHSDTTLTIQMSDLYRRQRNVCSHMFEHT
jgi:hypothetical protein